MRDKIINFWWSTYWTTDWNKWKVSTISIFIILNVLGIIFDNLKYHTLMTICATTGLVLVVLLVCVGLLAIFLNNRRLKNK